MPAKPNSDKIDDLLILTANLSARLDGHDVFLDSLSKLIEKSGASFTEVSVKLAVFEVHIAGIEALKKDMSHIKDIERECALLKKDFDDLSRFRDEYKAQVAERSRRIWAFGPNIVGALITAIISAIVALTVTYLNRHP